MAKRICGTVDRSDQARLRNESRSRSNETVWRLSVRFIQKIVSCVTFASIAVLIAGAGMAPLAADFELAGSYTQNIPCKGDGSDPKESQVKISPEESRRQSSGSKPTCGSSQPGQNCPNSITPNEKPTFSTPSTMNGRACNIVVTASSAFSRHKAARRSACRPPFFLIESHLFSDCMRRHFGRARTV
jgi:hypothetical protein